MRLEATGMTSGSGTTKKVWGSPTLSVAEVIKRVEADDPTLTVVDFSNSASYQMKGDDFTAQLCEALKKNTRVKELNLMNCNIGDRGGEKIGEALAENNSVVTLVLEKNRLNQHGASAIAKGLAKNRKVETINLMNQTNSRWGDSCLDDWVDMLYHNVTLVKIYWRLESRKSFAINKMLTRNHEIDRRKKNGMSYDDLLPEAVRGQNGGTEFKQGSPPISTQSSYAPATGGDVAQEKPILSNASRVNDLPHGANGSGANGSGANGSGANGSVAQRYTSQNSDTAEDKIPSTPNPAATCGSLRDRLKMFQQACQSTPGPAERTANSAPRRTWGNPISSVVDIIRRIDANEATLISVDLSNSASYQMKSDDYSAQLSTALSRNTHLKELNLANCAIGDRGAEHIGRALSLNKSVTSLVLDRNRVGPAGAGALARGLTNNKALETLHLMDQGGGSRFGDTCLDEFITMLASNSTLLKIFWRLDSRKSVTINRLLTRNSEIDRRRRNGMPFNDLIPDGATNTSTGTQVAQPASPAPAPVPPAASEKPVAKPTFAAETSIKAPASSSLNPAADRSDYGPPLWASEVKEEFPPVISSSPDFNGTSPSGFLSPLYPADPPVMQPVVATDSAEPPPPVTPAKSSQPPEGFSAYDLLQQYAVTPPRDADQEHLQQQLSPVPQHPDGYQDYAPQVPVTVPDLSKNVDGPGGDQHHNSFPSAHGNGSAVANGNSATISPWDD